MGLETMNFIEDFVTSNPVGGADQKAEGDNHIRGMKTALKATFPGFAGRFQRFQEKSTTYTAVLNDNSSVIRASGTWTLSLTAATTLGNGWMILLYNDGAGVITVDPNGAETINGAATFSLAAAHFAFIYCNGTAFYAIINKNSSYVSATDRILGRSSVGSGSVEEIVCTSAGRAILDDADAAAQRATLGLGSLATASSVNRSALSTTTAAGSVSIGPISNGTYTLTGSTYSWWTGSADINGSSVGVILFGSGNQAAGVIGLHNSDGTISVSFYADERYVQASPPYKKPFYGFLAVDSLGKIQHCSFAPDPPWAYHGPTDITPEYFRKGKGYRKVRSLGGMPLAMALEDPALLKQYLDDAPIELMEQEITLDFKDSDICVVPHPFQGVNLTGLIIVEIDGPMLSRLSEMCDLGHADQVRKLFLEDKIRFHNTPNKAHQRQGILCTDCYWKLTK